MYRIVIKKKVQKQFNHLSTKDQKRILEALKSLRMDPFVGKKLQGPLLGLWSIRVMPFRIIYSVSKKTVTVSVVAVGDRKDVYKKIQ